MLHCNYIRFKDLIKQGKILSISPKYKLKNENIMEYGNTAVVSQEKDLIVGYTDLIDDKLLQPPYFIFGDHTEITKFIDFPFVQGADGVKIYKGNGVDIITEYLYYAVNVCYNKTGFYERHSKYLARTLIPIPNLDYQLKIVNYIKSYDDLIRNNENQIKILEEMADKLYKEWFVYFRFPGYEKVDFHEGIPTQWEYIQISDVAEVVGGGTPATDKEEYWNGNIPWLSPVDLNDFVGVYIDRGASNITDLGYKKSSAKMMPKNTILLSSRAPIGYLALAKNDICTNQGFKSLICNERCLYSYLYLYIKNNIEYLKQFANGATFPELSAKMLKKIKIILPPMDLMKQFHSKIEIIFELIDNCCESLKKLKEQRDLLLPNLMSGKLSV